MPAQRSRLNLDRTFSEQEYERISLGFIPDRMEDKWFMFTEGDTLYIHRSWTGHCIYQIRFRKNGTGFSVADAYANRDTSQYSDSNDAYDERMSLFLIDYLLLNKKHPMPMPGNVVAGLETELHYSHILGAGQREDTGPVNVTIRGTLRWLWRWLAWLVGR